VQSIPLEELDLHLQEDSPIILAMVSWVRSKLHLSNFPNGPI